VGVIRSNSRFVSRIARAGTSTHFGGHPNEWIYNGSLRRLNAAPPIHERAATRGHTATEGGDECAGVKRRHPAPTINIALTALLRHPFGCSIVYFDSDQDKSGSAVLELSAPSQTGLFPANPRVINLYLTVQRFPSRIHYRAESSSGEGQSRTSAKPGVGTWRTDGIAGSPIRRLGRARIEDR
jgi:hypothetical protein